MNQRRFFFYILHLCDLKYKKIEEALNSGKSSASLAGHRYNAGDRIIKVSNKSESGMRCQCVYCAIGACYSLAWVH